MHEKLRQTVKTQGTEEKDREDEETRDREGKRAMDNTHIHTHTDITWETGN